MAASGGLFSRKAALYKPQPTVLVICEDTKSGKKYLDDATYHFRINVDVEVCHCGKTDPLGIVNAALERQSRFDKIYCVIDRDRHESFDEAVALAKLHSKIQLIVSYPCFEFWLLLHFGHCRKPYVAAGSSSPGDVLIKDLRSKPGMGGYDKGKNESVFISLQEKFDVARKLSPVVLKDAVETGEMNPSTTLHELIGVFETLAAPQKI